MWLLNLNSTKVLVPFGFSKDFGLIRIKYHKKGMPSELFENLKSGLTGLE